VDKLNSQPKKKIGKSQNAQVQLEIDFNGVVVDFTLNLFIFLFTQFCNVDKIMTHFGFTYSSPAFLGCIL
jgi:hypothetical protein